MAPTRHARKPVFHPGVPIEIMLPFVSTHYPGGVTATVVSHHLNADGTLFVPADPTTVAWARDDAAPGSGRGTTILTSHINYVIDGQTVVGAFADLAEYARNDVGKRFTVKLAGGRVLSYRVVAGREYSKSDLATDPGLRAALYDQTRVYGPAGHQSGRLLLVSCGGAFDPVTGEYQDNVFLYALPVS